MGKKEEKAVKTAAKLGNDNLKSIFIDTVKGGKVSTPSRGMADVKTATKIFDERSTAKATMKHNKQGHADKLVRNDFLVGSGRRIKKKFESSKKRSEHISKIKNDTKRRKKYPNQK